VEIEEGGLGGILEGVGPVNAEMFKLKLKMNRCCTFYNITRPGWLMEEDNSTSTSCLCLHGRL
jgi:hypothetical protein